jgi:hypothetical protein
MTKTVSYGAVSFDHSRTGRLSPQTIVGANNIVGAIARAAQLRRALVERLMPQIGAVAFELIDDVENNSRTITLSKFGAVPDDCEIYAAVMEAVGLQHEGPDQAADRQSSSASSEQENAEDKKSAEATITHSERQYHGT